MAVVVALCRIHTKFVYVYVFLCVSICVCDFVSWHLFVSCKSVTLAVALAGGSGVLLEAKEEAKKSVSSSSMQKTT